MVCLRTVGVVRAQVRPPDGLRRAIILSRRHAMVRAAVQEPYAGGESRSVASNGTMRSLTNVDVPPGRTALFEARERAMVLQRAGLDLLQHLEGRNAAQLAYHVLPLPLDCFHALRQFAGNGLVGEPQPHLLQRGALDFA